VTFNDQPAENDVIPVPADGSANAVFGGGSSRSMLNPNLLNPTRREGDPVEVWRGAGYVNSGIMFPKPQLPPGFPLIDTFSLRFDKPGVYPYYCGMHDFHNGVVVVEPKTALDVPGQQEIDDQGESEMEYYTDITGSLELILTSDRIMDMETGPDGSSVYIVSAGMGPPEAELTEFIPKRLEIEKGDTVVWASSRWHSIVFNPGGAFPPLYTPMEQEDGTLWMVINHQVLQPVKAGQEFTGEGLYSSGLIGFGNRPGGVGYSLTFAVTGTFRYMCPIHPGMVGTVVVKD
jgi:plastocyanin